LLNIENVNISLKKTLPLANKFNDQIDSNDNFILKIAKTNATVLLLGDSGTGKSNLARKIHKNSCLRNGPFVEIQCTTIPENLLESELFGHEKGSFTGAYKTQVGKAEQAIGGTLFLDEIGELNLANQAKLLKLMQDKVVTRIGSTQDMKIDTRIIVATNRNLLEMVQNGSLRRDLYYRMNIFEVKLQNLTLRRTEIIPFAQTFILEFNQREKTRISQSLSPQLKLLITNYSWPGNIRELKNVIDRLCYLSEDSELQIEHLPECFHNSFDLPQNVYSNERFIKRAKTLKQLEKEYIQFVLSTEENFELAASTLGITTVTLWRKRKEYDL
jgi:transcriptional regulator with PAS, ATPase and Fis domain